jgi:glucose 1-dehydrogenase
MSLLSNQVAVITGASRGLGFAIAQAYAAEGAAVVLAARSRNTLDHSVELIQKQGFEATSMACDTSNPEAAESLADFALQNYGRLDIWVNNAGIGAPYGPTLSIEPNRFEQVIRTNIDGVYYGSMAALKRFLPQKAGKLINLIGRGSDGPVPFQNAYASSKTWVRSFTLALAREYRHSGVGIFAFNPGLVLTDMLTQVDVISGYGQKVLPLNTVIRLWANPPSVPAQKALWLASAATNGKTGLAINVLTPSVMIGGLVKEAWRMITRQPSPTPTIQTHEVPPVPVLDD